MPTVNSPIIHANQAMEWIKTVQYMMVNTGKSCAMNNLDQKLIVRILVGSTVPTNLTNYVGEFVLST